MTQQLQIPRTVEYIDVNPEELETQLNEEQLAFEHFRQSFESEEMGTLKVQRVPVSKTGPSNPGKIRGIHCFSCSVDQYNYDALLDYIRDTYGGGLYRIIATRSGKKGLGFNRLVEIASPFEHINNEGENKPSQSSELNAMLNTVNAIVRDSQERTEQMLERLSPQLTQANPMGMFKETIELLATMGVLGNTNSGGDGLAELRKFVELKTLAKDLLGDDVGGGDPGFYGMITETIKQFGGPLMLAVQQGAQSGALNPTPAAARPQPQTIEATPAQPTPEKPEQPTEAQMEQLKQLQSVVAILIANAKAGVDAVQFASVVVDQTPDEQLETLHTQAAEPEYIDNLIKLNPEVAEYRGWFQKLREEILRLLNEMLEPEDGEVIEPGLQAETDGAIVRESGGAVTGETDTGNPDPDATIERTETPEKTDADDATGDT